MDFDRVFNFIYYGFIGERENKLRSVTNPDLLKYILNDYGIKINNREVMKSKVYMARMSVDLLYRYSIDGTVDDKSSKPWPSNINYLYSMASLNKKSSRAMLKKFNFDIEQITEICAIYASSNLLENDLVKLTNFLNDGDEMYAGCMEEKLKHKIFINGFVNLFKCEINSKSFFLRDGLKEQGLVYLNTALAIKIMDEISGYQRTDAIGMNFSGKHVLSFYKNIMMREILSKDANEIYCKLQAFIDLFILGAYQDDVERKARRNFIEQIVKSTFDECACLKVTGVAIKTNNISDDYGEKIIDYMTKIPFSKYNKKAWYKELCNITIENKCYANFIMAMLSFMPAKTNMNLIVERAQNAMRERYNKKNYTGDRKALNVKVDPDIFLKLKDIEDEFGLLRLDAVMMAIRHTHDDFFRKKRTAGSNAGVMIKDYSEMATLRYNDSSARKRNTVKPTKVYTLNKNQSAQQNDDLRGDSAVHTVIEDELNFEGSSDEFLVFKAADVVLPDDDLKSSPPEQVDSKEQSANSTVVDVAHFEPPVHTNQTATTEPSALDHIDDAF